MIDYQKYTLRYAAGIYWLIEIDQRKPNYVQPLPMNETGALIWKWMKAGYTPKDITKMLHNQYKITCEEANKDVRGFLEQLSIMGIIKGDM